MRHLQIDVGLEYWSFSVRYGLSDFDSIDRRGSEATQLQDPDDEHLRLLLLLGARLLL